MNKMAAVREFMQAAEQPTADTPHIPPLAQRLLRINLIAEELAELAAASGIAVAIHTRGPEDNPTYDYFSSRAGPGIKPDGDVIDIADALADLLYVVYGAAVTYGIDIGQVFDAVHRSNMSKFIDSYTRSDGKLMKGPSWQPPNIQAILDAQMS